MSATAHVPFIELDRREHIYYVDGERVDLSSTGVLKSVGAINTDFFTEESRRRGTLVHAMTELPDRDLEDPELPRVNQEIAEFSSSEIEIAAPFVAQWVARRENFHFDIAPGGVEQMAYCAAYGYATMIDRNVVLRAPCVEKALVEIKTRLSNTVEDWWGLQLASQAHALDPGELYRRFSVILTPDKSFVHEFPIEDFVRDRDIFLSMANTARWLKAHRREESYA